MTDTPKPRNIIDSYRSWTDDLIKEDLQKKAFPYAVLMTHVQGDFNIGTVIRNANAFGAKNVFYYGTRKWDRRGTVGSHIRTPVQYLSSLEEIIELKKEYTLVALEQTSQAVKLPDFVWPDKFLLVVGEEGPGIAEECLDLCDLFVEIPMFGSVRSLNVGTASGIAMNDFVSKRGS